MIFHRMAFDTYEVIVSSNIHLDDENIVEAIKMELPLGPIYMKLNLPMSMSLL